MVSIVVKDMDKEDLLEIINLLIQNQELSINVLNAVMYILIIFFNKILVCRE